MNVKPLIMSRYSDLKILLLEVRESQEMIEHELACVMRASELPRENFTVYNVLERALPAGLEKDFHLVVIGGTGDYQVSEHRPSWFEPLMAFTRHLCREGYPLLGLCYGFHVIAHALGGVVERRADLEETGTYDIFLSELGLQDPVLKELGPVFPAQQGHHDVVMSCPEEVEHLARSEKCFWQALRLTDRPIYGFQFHAELRREDFLMRMRRYADSYASTPDLYESIVQSTRETENDVIIRNYLERIVLPYWDSAGA